MAFQGDSIFWVEVEKIVPNPFQPRREFDEMRLKELSESVRMYGILQPLTVTRREIQNEDGSFRSEYELIAGERRLRASKLAGLAQVPVIIREGEQSEQEKLELAIIENLQREDLNAVDRAIAFRQLADVFGLSHSQVAVKVGRSREYVSNSIRLLALPDYMLNSLKSGDISEGHARTLLMLNDRPEEQDTVFREILLKKLSVREVERIARGIASEKIRKKGDYDADLIEMEKKFTETLGTRVSITKTEFGGRLSIDYFTQEDLEEILAGMKRDARKMASVGTALGMPAVTALGAVSEPGELANPRADELAILTERTGLEMVSDDGADLQKSVVSEVSNATVPIIPIPQIEVEMPADIVPEDEYFKADNDPTADETVVEGVISNEGIESGATAEAKFVGDVPAPIAEAIPAVVIEEVSVPAGNQAMAAPVVNIEPVVAPTIQTPVRSSLRDQLASLLGGVKAPMVPVAAASAVVVAETMPEAVASVVEDIVAPMAEVDAPNNAEKTPESVEATADESDLYSLRDFSI